MFRAHSSVFLIRNWHPPVSSWPLGCHPPIPKYPFNASGNRPWRPWDNRIELAMGDGSDPFSSHDDQRLLKMTRCEYPLVNVYITLERSTIFHGKIHYKWWFSIVMLVYQMWILCMYCTYCDFPTDQPKFCTAPIEFCGKAVHHAHFRAFGGLCKHFKRRGKNSGLTTWSCHKDP